MNLIKKTKRLNFLLTEREMEYVLHMIEDIPDKQIADRMCISLHTVNTHRNNIRRKLNVSTKLGIFRLLVSGNLSRI